MSEITWKSGTFEYPKPATMVSCGTMEKSNIITVANCICKWRLLYLGKKVGKFGYSVQKRKNKKQR